MTGDICPVSGEPHDGAPESIRVSIMDHRRTVIGTCIHCHRTIMAQEPEYRTVLAPQPKHQFILPRGMWECPSTGMDHSPGLWTYNNTYQCINCYRRLSVYRFRDNLTGESKDVFLFEITIEEEPV